MWTISMLRTWPLRQRLRASMLRTADRQLRPGGLDQVAVPGYDPLRVLITGGGVAVGHGVGRRQDALDGPLARLLAASSGRGVRVSNVAGADETLSDQIVAASVSGLLHRQDVVVWSANVLEMCGSRWPRRWRSMLAELLAATSANPRVVVLTLPITEGASPYAATAAQLARTVNADLRRAARRFANVTVVDPPAMQVPEVGAPQIDAAYYERLADLVHGALQRSSARGRLLVH